MSSLTVLVQHLASVAIFCCSFVVIFQERVSPVLIVGWASFGSFLAWLVWDYWMTKEEVEAAFRMKPEANVDEDKLKTSNAAPNEPQGLGLGMPREGNGLVKEYGISENASPYVDPTSSLSPRNQRRLVTVKSAVLIYAALLGLSPILKSLTRSTTSDSIWALTTLLLCMNVAFFDYSSGTGTQ
jgi:phosphatidylinositol N-acetylglucosaminyltransferase subunit C